LAAAVSPVVSPEWVIDLKHRGDSQPLLYAAFFDLAIDQRLNSK
jgi:hypothetical protein